MDISNTFQSCVVHRLLKISRELEIYLKKKYHEFSSTN